MENGSGEKSKHTGERISLREHGRGLTTAMSIVPEERGRSRLRRVGPSPEFFEGLLALPNIFVHLEDRSECLVG